MPLVARLVLPLVLCAAVAHAETFRVVVVPPAGDKAAIKFADQVELALEANESVVVVSRDKVAYRLKGKDAFERRRLRGVMATANVDVVFRVFRPKGKARQSLTITAFGKDGLAVESLDVAKVKTPADAKLAARKISPRLKTLLARWGEKRKARAEVADKKNVRKAPAKDSAQGTPASAFQDWDSRVIQEDEETPPPPEDEERPRSPVSQDDVVDDESPPFATDGRRRASGRAEPRRDTDNPQDTGRVTDQEQEPAPSGPRKPLLVEEADQSSADNAKTGWVEKVLHNLFSLDQPTPYFLISAGPDVMVWSYTLLDSTLKRKTSVCSPDPTQLQTLLGCTPHGGSSLWVEAWPIRYIGLDSSFRLGGTVYRPARDTKGQPITSPDFVGAAVAEGHVALKARFVLTFGPLKGPALGARVRMGYTRSSVQQQQPFVAVPGYHAAQLGMGLEAYLPLLWKHLSFDARAELIPLVIYQETTGFPSDGLEVLRPYGTLNNPGSSSVSVGYRVDGGVRAVILYGAFIEARAFSEGFGVYFAGKGKRTDSTLRPLPDGRVANVSLGGTVALGWLFPQ